MRRQTLPDRTQEAQELARAVEVFAAKADASELSTLARILRRWPQMRAVTKDALFAAVVVEFRHVLEVQNVPAQRR
jgi:hypothetical protein